MKTGKNKATNNFIVRLWSKDHYGEDKRKFEARYAGSITEVQSKTVISFHTPGQLQVAIEKLYKACEKKRKAEKK